MKPASRMHIDAIIDASKKPAPAGATVEEYVAVLASPDSYFWVHFMDRPAHMVVQAAEHMAGVTKVRQRGGRRGRATARPCPGSLAAPPA